MTVRKALPAVLAAAAVVLLVIPCFAADAVKQYQESSDALYNLDFNIAQHGFEELTRQYPDNPDYWNALASTIWFKILYDQQKLNIESYSGASTFGTKDSKDAVNAADERRLRETIETSMKKSQAILDKNSKDVRALYAMGIANATLASFEATAKRSYLTAYGRAKSARNLHQQVLKLDSNFDDARMSVGIFDYVVGVVPPWFRLSLGIFMGMNGDGKDAGIQKIQTAAAKGKQVSTDARMALGIIYSREHRYEEAVRLMDELHSKYPRNFLFEMSKASIYGKMKRWDRASEVYSQILQKDLARTNGYERLRIARVYSELARTQIETHHEDDALTTYGKVITVSDATPNERADAHLWMGKVFDVKKDRRSALQHYDSVLHLDCDPGFKKEAEGLKKRAFGS